MKNKCNWKLLPKVIWSLFKLSCSILLFHFWGRIFLLMLEWHFHWMPHSVVVLYIIKNESVVKFLDSIATVFNNHYKWIIRKLNKNKSSFIWWLRTFAQLIVVIYYFLKNVVCEYLISNRSTKYVSLFSFGLRLMLMYIVVLIDDIIILTIRAVFFTFFFSIFVDI